MSDNSWKTRLYVTGAGIGALVGVGTAYLLARTADESGSAGPPHISTADAVKSVIGIIGIMRGIAALGDK